LNKFKVTSIFFFGLSFIPLLVSANTVDTISGHIGVLSNEFNQEVGNVPGNRYNGSLSFDYHKNPEANLEKDIERKFSFSTVVNDENLTMFSLGEAYLAGSYQRKNVFKAGRQILNWSKVDEVWGLGKLNNRQNFDYFQPGQEGLTGLYYERKSSNGIRYKAFLSGIYLPELNPALDVDKKEKTITSRHPWAEVPTSTVEVEPGNWKRIAYNIDYPELSEVVYRYTLGANIGFENKNWVWDNFFIRKPENQLSALVSISLDPAEDVVVANINPQFYYHDVYGSTLKYRNRDLELFISGMASRPNTFPDGDAEATRATDIKTEKTREDYLSGGISRTNDNYGLGLNYIARLSPFDRNKESLAPDPRWNQALNAFIYKQLGRKLRVQADIKYDMLTNDRLTMFLANYQMSKSFHGSFGVNMIGTPEDGKSFWSPYTNNDSVYGALKYVF
jgi:hypothetical protein